MKILAVDTSAKSGSVALLEDSKVLAQISGCEEALYSERLFRDLGKVQAKAQIHLKEIELFAVTTGPGSFTGLRVGLTAVKALAEVYQKPIAGVSVLLAVAAQSKESAGMVAAFMDARRGQLYGALYERTGGDCPSWRLHGEEALLSQREFLARIQSECGTKPPTLVSATPEALDAALVEALLPGNSIEAVSEILAPVVGRLGFEQAQRGELQNALSLDANYIRRSDAEVLWKGA